MRKTTLVRHITETGHIEEKTHISETARPSVRKTTIVRHITETDHIHEEKKSVRRAISEKDDASETHYRNCPHRGENPH